MRTRNLKGPRLSRGPFRNCKRWRLDDAKLRWGEASILLRLIAESPRHHTLRGVLGYAYGVTGRIQDARDALEILTEPGLRGEYDYAYPSALTLLGLNQSRRAMECLERSYHHGSLWSLGFHSDPILEPLHTDPHFTFIGKFTHS